jgi:hypothetical protein
MTRKRYWWIAYRYYLEAPNEQEAIARWERGEGHDTYSISSIGGRDYLPVIVEIEEDNYMRIVNRKDGLDDD